MYGRLVAGLFLLFSVSDAYVDSGNSRIYDEYDFIGKSSVTVDGLCAEQCLIFASITEDTYKLASNILIQLQKGFDSVALIAESIDPATNQKIPLGVKNMPSLTIVNANAQLTAGPMVIYIVKVGKSMPLPLPEVYEASVLHRPGTSIPKSVTIMSTQPFTVKQAAGQQPKAVVASLSGYDDTIGGCPTFQFTESEFTFEVNGPIVTLNYSTFTSPPGLLSSTIGITNMLPMQSEGWVSSPGYSGCPGRQVYRSSLYDNMGNFHAEITNDQPTSVSVDIATNSEHDNAVSITDEDSGEFYTVYGMGDSNPKGFNFNTKKFSISWMPDGTSKIHFFVKWRKN